MAEMGFAFAALDFGAMHEEAVGGLGFDVALLYGCDEAWPVPESNLLRTEQVAATDGLVDACAWLSQYAPV